jgi:hypothetical protein
MLLAAEGVGDIPVVWSGLAGYIFAALDVLGLHLLSAVATDVGAHRGARHSAADSGDILTAPATDLVTENATDYGAGNRPGNVGAASILHDLFALDPASLLGWSDHRAH